MKSNKVHEGIIPINGNNFTQRFQVEGCGYNYEICRYTWTAFNLH